MDSSAASSSTKNPVAFVTTNYSLVKEKGNTRSSMVPAALWRGKLLEATSWNWTLA